MNKLIFLHLVKNGGSTMREIIEREYGRKYVMTIDNSNESDFLNMTREEKEILKVLQGHMQFGHHQRFESKVFYITLLRKPFSRILSFYNYFGTLPNHPRYEEVINSSFYDFMVNSEGRPNIHNGQVRNISGIDDKPELMLEKALDNIEKHFSVVGLLERYEESLIIMKQFLGWKKYPTYAKRNVSKKLLEKSEVTERESKLLNEMNKADIQLYEIMEGKFDQMIDKIGRSNFNRELERLKRKNQKYAKYDVFHRYLNALRKKISS